MTSYRKRFFNEFPSYQESDTAGEDDADWLALNVACNMQKISQNVSQLEKLIKQIGTPLDSEELRDKVSQTTHYLNQLAKDTNSDMKDLARLLLPSDLTKQGQLKMQRERLREEFRYVLKNFQTVQRKTAEKEKSSFKDELVSGAQFSPSGYSQTAQELGMKNDVDLNLIRERESALHQLEKDIMDVYQIIEVLAMLVHEEEEFSDAIEDNVELPEIDVQEGQQLLAKYQKKTGKKLCCLIVLLMIILAIIGIIIAVVFSNNK